MRLETWRDVANVPACTGNRGHIRECTNLAHVMVDTQALGLVILDLNVQRYLSQSLDFEILTRLGHAAFDPHDCYCRVLVQLLQASKQV